MTLRAILAALNSQPDTLFIDAVSETAEDSDREVERQQTRAKASALADQMAGMLGLG